MTSGVESKSLEEDPAVSPEAGEPVRKGSGGGRLALVLGLTAISAVAAYLVVRKALDKAPADPTTERIQSLIDEANTLLKQLDEQKRR
jgi:hypothetical protein